MEKEIILHRNAIDRLECAMLNHHVLIHSIRQVNGVEQIEIDRVKIDDKCLLEDVVHFIKEAYISSIGFQGLFETNEFKYVTGSVKADSFYKFADSHISLMEFSQQSQINGADFFDFSFPEDFLD